MDNSGIRDIDDLKKHVAAATPPIPVIGCSLEDVQSLEEQLGIRLPATYKAFLLWMGNDGGPIMRGSSCFYRDIIRIQVGAVELLQEDDFSHSLPEDALVIWMHQGYQFAFVRLSEGENPPVYFYNEGEEQDDFREICQHYTDFLKAHVENSLEFWKQNPNWHMK